MNYYISDCHFGHKNIIGFDQRPFFSVSEMDETMIKNWQNVVHQDDTVYILGDFCWDNATRWNEILDQLPGNKVAILGNHDQVLARNKDLQKRFLGVYNYLEIVDNMRNIVPCHFPIPVYKNLHHGWYHLYGHVHETEDYVITKRYFEEIAAKYHISSRAYNVGTSLLGYTPRTLDELITSKIES